MVTDLVRLELIMRRVRLRMFNDRYEASAMKAIDMFLEELTRYNVEQSNVKGK